MRRAGARTRRRKPCTHACRADNECGRGRDGDNESRHKNLPDSGSHSYRSYLRGPAVASSSGQSGRPQQQPSPNISSEEGPGTTCKGAEFSARYARRTVCASQALSRRRPDLERPPPARAYLQHLRHKALENAQSPLLAFPSAGNLNRGEIPETARVKFGWSLVCGRVQY
jgi:hypothetical protein